MRFLILLVLPALLVVAACGGDDDGGTSSPTPVRSTTAAASATAAVTGESTESPTPVATATVQPTREITPTQTRRDVAYDHYGQQTNDVLEVLNGVIPDPVPCPYDAVDIVINCTAQGFGRIALDTPPQGDIAECRALTGPNSALVAASCTTTVPSLWFYKLVE